MIVSHVVFLLHRDVYLIWFFYFVFFFGFLVIFSGKLIYNLEKRVFAKFTVNTM